MGRIVDWDVIKQDYIYGYDQDGVRIARPSYRMIAERHKVNEANLRARGAKEKWISLRSNFSVEWQQIASEKMAETMADQVIKFDTACVNIAKDAIMLIQGKINSLVEYFEKHKNFDVETFNDLALALSRYQKVGRLALNKSTENIQDLPLAKEDQEILDRYLSSRSNVNQS